MKFNCTATKHLGSARYLTRWCRALRLRCCDLRRGKDPARDRENDGRTMINLYIYIYIHILSRLYERYCIIVWSCTYVCFYIYLCRYSLSLYAYIYVCIYRYIYIYTYTICNLYSCAVEVYHHSQSQGFAVHIYVLDDVDTMKKK